MTRRATIRVLVAAATLGCASGSRAPGPAVEVQADVEYLASVKLMGRAPGTPGSDSAAFYITRRYRSLQIPGAFPLHCRVATQCGAEYFQPFDARMVKAKNIAAVIPGTDSTLHEQFVVVGAHYDHIGTSPFYARDAGAVVRPGADDNASGTAAVLGLARRFAHRPARRSILFVHFDAEEWGLIGSRFFVSELGTAPIVFMLNLDMVGRLRGKPLGVHIPSSSRALRALVDSVAGVAAFNMVGAPDAGRSDIESFAAVGIPAVGLFTGFHADYHSAADRAARLDVAGIVRVVDFAEVLLRAVADRQLVRPE